MSSEKAPIQRSIFFELLGVVFITLKLLGVIDWSWWWVLAPIWMPASIGIVIIIVCLIFKYIL